MDTFFKPFNNLHKKFTSSRSLSLTGFTLIELVMVLAVLGLMAAIVIPKAFNLKGERLGKEARHLVTYISHLSTEAAIKKKPLRLYYDLDEGRYWAIMLDANADIFEEKPLVTPLLRKVTFPQGISFHEVAVKGRINTNRGITYTSFTPWGYRDKTRIHLKTEKDRILTITIPSIGERIKVYKGYVEN